MTYEKEDIYRLEEYKALRKAISQEKDLRIRLLSIMIPAIGILLGLSTTIPNERLWVVILAIFIMINLCAYLTASSELVIRSFGSYIKVFIESQVDGLLWESLIPNFERERHKIYIKNYMVVYATLGLFAFFFTIGISWNNLISINILVAILGFLVLLYVLYLMIKSNSSATRLILIEHWENIYNQTYSGKEN